MSIEGDALDAIMDPTIGAATVPASSWARIRNWDAAPSAPPPPTPSLLKNSVLKRRANAPAGPQPPECDDPGCRDPMCGPMERRGTGPRSSDLSRDKDQLQRMVLGLAKDNRAEDIRRLITTHELSANFGNQVGHAQATRTHDTRRSTHDVNRTQPV
jgi:hypothetical protein